MHIAVAIIIVIAITAPMPRRYYWRVPDLEFISGFNDAKVKQR